MPGGLLSLASIRCRSAIPQIATLWLLTSSAQETLDIVLHYTHALLWLPHPLLGTASAPQGHRLGKNRKRLRYRSEITAQGLWWACSPTENCHQLLPENWGDWHLFSGLLRHGVCDMPALFWCMCDVLSYCNIYQRYFDVCVMSTVFSNMPMLYWWTCNVPTLLKPVTICYFEVPTLLLCLTAFVMPLIVKCISCMTCHTDIPVKSITYTELLILQKLIYSLVLGNWSCPAESCWIHRNHFVCGSTGWGRPVGGTWLRIRPGDFVSWDWFTVLPSVNAWREYWEKCAQREVSQPVADYVDSLQTTCPHLLAQTPWDKMAWLKNIMLLYAPLCLWGST